MAYQGLGQVCYERSYNKSAIEYFKKQLSLAKENNDVKQQILALCMIGRSYINMLKIKRGIKCLKFALKLAIDAKDEDGQNHVLSDLAYGYTWAGNIEKASTYFKGLIERLSDDKYSLVYIRSLQSLGQIYTFKNDAEQALIYFDEALCLIQALNHKMMKIRAFADFALFYNECKKDHRSAIKFAKKGLADAHETGSIRYILHFHVYLTIFYADLYQLHDAHIHTQEVLRLYQNHPEFIDSDQKLIVYACLGKVNWVSGQRIQAVFFAIRGVIACPPWKSINGRWVLRETIITVFQPLKEKLNWLKTKFRIQE
ncbi:MAG: tetratricopeptide repeat protein [Thainema sp.]